MDNIPLCDLHKMDWGLFLNSILHHDKYKEITDINNISTENVINTVILVNFQAVNNY